MQSPDYDAIVAGGGHNGLVAGAYLARAGLRTLILERRSLVGGAAVTEEPWPGWRVSTASYVVTLLDPEIVRDLNLTAHGYFAYRKNPSSFTPLLDGQSLMLGADAVANDREIAAFSKRDVAGFRAFNAQAERLGAAVHALLDDDDPQWSKLDPVTRRDLEGSVAEIVERYVETPVLQANLAGEGIVGTYRGVRDPGTGYVMAHHGAGKAAGTLGAWAYVRGGMGAISQAIASAARTARATILTAAEVEKFVIEGGRVQGVALHDGREFRAPIVLSNAHPRTTFLELAGADYFEPEFLHKLDRWESNGPSLKLNLALGEVPNFTARPGNGPAAHHRASIHVAPDLDFLQRAYDDARTHGCSREPFLEGYMQSPTDPGMVPAGKHVLSIFAQYYPYERADGPWTAAKRNAAADAIVASLARFAPNLPNAIEARQLLAPPDLEERFGLNGGHIFHGELLPHQIFEKRFSTRTPLPGLYLCGSGAHPGGCVSGIPGKRAARAVLAEASQLVASSA